MIGNHHGANSVFAEKLGVRPGLVGDWLVGRCKPKDLYRNKICAEFSVSRKWLDTGDGEMMVGNVPSALSQNISLSERDIGRLEGEIKGLKESVERYEHRLDKYDKEISEALRACAKLNITS